MSSRIFWAVFSVLAFLLLIPLSIAFYRQWQIYNKGSIVEVTITSLPGKLTKNGNMKFEFNGKINSMSINGNSSNYLHIGEKIQLRHLDGYDMFLFANFNPIGQWIFLLAATLFCAIYFTYNAFKKSPLPANAFGKKLG